MTSRFKKKKVLLPKFRRDLNIALTHDGTYDPDLIFAYWKRSYLWALWQKEGMKKDDSSLKLALNYPEYVLRDFRRWWLAQTDAEHLIIVPWDETDKWLKKNGFTGKVDEKVMERFVNAGGKGSTADVNGAGGEQQQRDGEICCTRKANQHAGDGVCPMHE